MSTRKLIIAALLCGLAILAAGGVLLVNLAANRNELTVPDPLPVRPGADVAGVVATVLDSRRADPNVVAVTVRLQAPPDTALDDAGRGWALVIGSAREPVAVPGGDVACDGLAVAPGSVRECVVAFAAAQGSPFVEYARGGERARWRLGG